MSLTTNLRLVLTGADEVSMTFLEWRTLMNGTDVNSNMELIDKAIGELIASNEGKADGFSFNPDTGILSLTSGGTALGNESATISLAKYIDEVTQLKGDLNYKFESDGIGKNKFNPNTTENGKLNYSNGVIDTTDTTCVTSDYISIPSDVTMVVVSLENYSSITYQRIAFYNSSKEFMSCTYSGTTAVEIPSGASFVRVSNNKTKKIFVGFNTDGSYDGFEEFVFGKLKENMLPNDIVKKNELNLLENKINAKFPISQENTTFFDIEKSTNLLPPSDLEIGRLKNGELDATQSNYVTTTYVKIDGNDGRYLLVENTKSVISWNAYAFYDPNKNFISGIDHSGNTAIVIPNNSYYFRASSGSSATPTSLFIGISDTEDAIPYEKYYNNAFIKEEYIRGITKNWYKGKKATALGDSITANASTYTASDGRTGSAWREFVAQELELADTIYNCGVSGSKVSGNNTSNPAMWTDERINAIPEDTEVLFFNGGMNDWGGSVQLGEEDSTDTDTFYGALNTIVTKLMTRFPTIPIFFMTTTYGYNSENDKNSIGLTQYDYGRAIKKIAEKNGFPCIDLHALCGWNRLNISNYVNNEGGAFIHPNRNGGRKIATAILSVVKQYQPCEIE